MDVFGPVNTAKGTAIDFLRYAVVANYFADEAIAIHRNASN
jgi:hypothetical protein